MPGKSAKKKSLAKGLLPSLRRKRGEDSNKITGQAVKGKAWERCQGEMEFIVMVLKEKVDWQVRSDRPSHDRAKKRKESRQEERMRQNSPTGQD